MKYAEMLDRQLVLRVLAANDVLQQNPNLPEIEVALYHEDMEQCTQELHQRGYDVRSSQVIIITDKDGIKQGGGYESRSQQFKVRMREGDIDRVDCEVCSGHDMVQKKGDELIKVATCGNVDCMNFVPVERLFTVHFGPEKKPTFWVDPSEPGFIKEIAGKFPSVGVQLCADCIRKLGRKWIQWGVMFCDKEGCDGFHEDTGVTKPIGKDEDGCWVESKCNKCGATHWEPFD